MKIDKGCQLDVLTKWGVIDLRTLILKQHPCGCKRKDEKADEIIYRNENPHAALKPRFVKEYPPEGNMVGSDKHPEG
jgi:hypothetical protein